MTPCEAEATSGVGKGSIISGLGVGRGSRGELTEGAGRTTVNPIKEGISVADLLSAVDTEVASSEAAAYGGEAAAWSGEAAAYSGDLSGGEPWRGEEYRGEC